MNNYKMIEVDGKKFLEITPPAHSSAIVRRYELLRWSGRRTDVYGNNRACSCPELMKVVGMFCVCIGMAFCPKHGGPRCVGGHD